MHSSARVAVGLAVVATGLAVEAASAAPTWLGPATLSAPGDGASAARVAAEAGGGAIVSWSHATRRTTLRR
jgi:hypothetical protein